MENNNDDNLVLGGSIELSGFKEIDGGSMIILKKIVGNFAKRLSERSDKFERLHVTMKPVHSVSEMPKKFELHAKVVDNGQVFVSECVENNLFLAVDSALKKVSNSMG
jgi:hypothetical protein